ncbi:hypothetical protein IQ06DRAFT_284192 [Phaeosphaeriaceae sp. SRC1lsM3a]|nr:hypothetical protein IQ06DRAFT_284192 [Stagonospora sp. SRC1lsM3a]
MKSRLLGFLHNTRWVPSDIPSPDTTKAKSKPKSRNPFASSSSTWSRDVVPLPTAPLDARTHAQDQSIFFAKLPLELRTMVYEYLMGEGVVHLTMGSKKRFGHFVCEDELGGRECRCRVLVGGGKEGGRLDGGCAAVVRTCRRMYAEAVPHLYRSHAFSLLHSTHLLYLPTRIPQPRIETIRALRLRWAIRGLPQLRRGPSQRLAYREDTANWERGWAIIAGMAGLRDLYVAIIDPSPQVIWERNWIELEQQLLEPVKKVTAPEWFELTLPFSGCRTDWDMGESKVVLRRPEGEEEEDDE